MKKDNTFKFRTSISREGYEDKKTAQLCLSTKSAKAIGKVKMAFKEQEVTVDEFIDYAISGHAFCNLFKFDENKKYLFTNAYRDKNGIYHSTYTFPIYKVGLNKGCFKLSFKSDAFFRGSQTVFVDVDFTHYDSLESYISCLTYKPTCAYYSYSDNIDKHGIISRRFRLVYVFDTELNSQEFRSITFQLYDSIVNDTKEQMYDMCGCSYSQYMNGSNIEESYKSEIIYSKDDFSLNYVVEQEEEEVPAESKETAIKEESKAITFDAELLEDLMMNKPYEFVVRKWYAKGLRYFTRSQVEFGDNFYVTTTEDFIKLPYFVNKVEDGHHRRRKLYKRAALRRLMKNDTTPDEILYNLYIDRYRFFDNTDEVLDINCLIERVKRAYKTDVEEIKEMNTFTAPKFVINDTVSDKRNAVAAARKDITDTIIGEMYDCSATVKTNLETLKAAGYSISQTRLYKWCNDYNVKPVKSSTRKKKEIVEGYNPNLSVRENMKVMGCTMYQVLKARDNFNQ